VSQDNKKSKGKRKWSIRKKLVLYTLPALAIIYILSVSAITVSLRKKAIEDAYNLAQGYIFRAANDVKASLNEDLGVAGAMAYSLAQLEDDSVEARESIVEKVLNGVLKNKQKYYSTWASLELAAYDPTWGKTYGRKRFTYYKQGNPIIDSVNIQGDEPGSTYLRLKNSKKEEITNPYYYSEYSVTSDSRSDVFGTSICVPILIDNQFAGLAGMDMRLDYFNYIAELKPFEKSNIFLLSNNGTIVSSSDLTLQGKPMDNILPAEVIEEQQLKGKVESGEYYNFTMDQDGEQFVIMAPIELGDSELPYSIGIVVPESIILQEVNQMIIFIVVASLIGLVIFGIVIWRISGGIAAPLHRVSVLIKQIASGNIDLKERVSVKSNDEVGEISESANRLIETLNRKEEFAKAIGEGDLERDYEPVSEEDTLGASLLIMRDNLKTTHAEEDKRSWVTSGLAKFSDLLRMDTSDLSVYYNRIASEIVKYTGTNQCGIFLLNDDQKDEEHLELVATYAYERTKYVDKRVEIGQGVVGQCFLEKDTIYLKELPEDYINITSGLGYAPPTNIVVIPLKIEEEVVGVIELASFKALENYRIEFLEKVAENMASTVSSLKNNERTKRLLEESQEQAEMLKGQEEEMRQNMEELEATQEEMRRTSSQMEQNKLIMDSLINMTGDSIIAFDQDYKIILINEVLEKRYKGTEFEMTVGDNILERLGGHRSEWEGHYRRVLAGEYLEFTIKSKLNNEDTFRKYTLGPIRNASGDVQYAVIITRNAEFYDENDVLSEDEFLNLS